MVLERLEKQFVAADADELLMLMSLLVVLEVSLELWGVL